MKTKKELAKEMRGLADKLHEAGLKELSDMFHDEARKLEVEADLHISYALSL